MKKVLKILGIVVLALVVVLAAFFAYAQYKNWKTLNTPILPDDYYKSFAEAFPAGGKLEEYYAGQGSYEVDHLEYKSDNKSIGTIHVYYPAELKTSGKQYPVVMVVNGSNTPAKIYLPFFQRLASWGFVAVGTDDPQAGTGETTSIALDFLLDESEIAGQIDRDNIGITGYSQGGAGRWAQLPNMKTATSTKQSSLAAQRIRYWLSAWDGSMTAPRFPSLIL